MATMAMATLVISATAAGGAHAFVAPELFGALAAHPGAVRDAPGGWQQRARRLADGGAKWFNEVMVEQGWLVLNGYIIEISAKWHFNHLAHIMVEWLVPFNG